MQNSMLPPVLPAVLNAKGLNNEIVKKIAAIAAPLVLVVLVTASAQAGEPFYPNDPYFFYNPELPGFPGQWHLVNTAPLEGINYHPGYGEIWHQANAGLDANLAGAWSSGYTGAGVIIGIVDFGTQGDHPDLVANYRADLSKNFSLDPLIANLPQGPLLISDNHGTSVAGVAVARGGNGIGGTGAAPLAQFAGLNIFTQGDIIPESEKIDALFWQSGVDPTTGEIEGDALIRIKNHSYSFISTPYVFNTSVVDAIAKTAENGVISVYSAGNARGQIMQNTTLEATRNSHYGIVVAALASDGTYSNYSSFGSNVFVTAPSSSYKRNSYDITTTDRTGSELGYNQFSDLNPAGSWYEGFPDVDYTSTFGGTSSAAPLVSGIMALGVEANSTLDVRMAKHALSATSRKVDAANLSWGTNGVGLNFSPDYGFGLIDAGAFVDTVHRAGYVTSQSVYDTGTIIVSTDSGQGLGHIPDNDPDGLTEHFSLTATQLAQPIEAVSVNLSVTSQSVFDLNATLSSPSGMESVLVYDMGQLDSDQLMIVPATASWDYLSNAFWGEDGIGTWSLTLADAIPGNTTIWNSYSVLLYLGDMELLNVGETILDHDVSARSLSVLNAGADLIITANRNFSVEHDVLVDGGRLIVNGNLGQSGSLDSQVTLTGGELGGSGTVTASRGVTNTAGTVSPGNAVGTLNINGNYTQEAGGSLAIDIAGANDYDKLIVSGFAALDGFLQPIVKDSYTPIHGDSFTVLEASAVTGYFAEIGNLTPTLLLKPLYNAADVTLTAERNYQNANLLGHLNVNQKAVAMAIDAGGESATGDFDTVLDQIDALRNYDQAARAFDSLSVKGGDGLLQSALVTANVQASNLALRLSNVRAGLNTADSSQLAAALRHDPFDGVLLASTDSDLTNLGSYNIPPEKDLGIFMTGKALSGKQNASTNQSGYSFNTKVMTLGFDRSIADEYVLGIFSSIYSSDVDVNDAGSKSKVTGGTLGLYGSRQWGRLFLDGAVSYGISQQSNSRRIVFPGLDRTAKSDADGNLFSLYAGLGRSFDLWGWDMIPYAAAQYINVVTDNYTESGAGSLDLSVDRQQNDVFQPGVGARISKTYTTAFGNVTPLISASVQHRYGDDESNVSARLDDGQTPGFSVLSDGRNDTFGTAGVGLTAVFNNNTSLTLEYNAVVCDSGYQEHGVLLGISFEF